MSRIPSPPAPPSLHLLPHAVRSAELIRGSAVRCGPGIRLVSWPETPSVRAAALGERLGTNRIAAHLTAAWVWGTAEEPGTPLEFIVRVGRAHQLEPRSGIRLHQYNLDTEDIVFCGGRAVTSPSRTLYDLLRADVFTHTQRLACRMLLAHHLGSRDSWLTQFGARGRPYAARVRQRITAI